LAKKESISAPSLPAEQLSSYISSCRAT